MNDRPLLSSLSVITFHNHSATVHLAERWSVLSSFILHKTHLDARWFSRFFRISSAASFLCRHHQAQVEYLGTAALSQTRPCQSTLSIEGKRISYRFLTVYPTFLFPELSVCVPVPDLRCSSLLVPYPVPNVRWSTPHRPNNDPCRTKWADMLSDLGATECFLQCARFALVQDLQSAGVPVSSMDASCKFCGIMPNACSSAGW